MKTWGYLRVRSVFLRKTDLTPRAVERSDPLPLLLFFFLFRGRAHTETVRGRAGWVRGVSREPIPPGQARLLLYTAAHEGLRRSLEPIPKAQASAEAG